VEARAEKLAKVECFNCHQKGHHKSDCPDLKVSAKDKGKKSVRWNSKVDDLAFAICEECS
jgi:hypothetical protein